MSGITFQILAVDHNDKVVQVITESNDVAYLDRIVENNDITWIGSEPCSMRVARK